ncbi:hypothetical protein VB005_08390 [Metarhizium brunneum]
MSVPAFEMSPVEQKRLQASLKTATGTFNQAVAVSQDALNDGLYYLFDKFEELKKMEVNSKKFGSINASMSYSEISLPVKSSNYRTVVFYCIFESGQLIVTDDMGRPKPPIKMDKWRFAFDVDFTTLQVPPQTQEHEEVKKKLKQLGDYSIKRLFLDFKTHKIRNFKKDLSSFEGHVWNNEDLQSFLSLMSFWGDPDKGVMKDPQKSTLGYYLTTPKPETVNPPAPTFPPTAMKHQHYKYIAPGKDVPDEGLKLGKNNMLLYLEMTQNQSFPKEDILEYSGNFVTPGMKGTTCISRDVFWDSYLIRNPPLSSPPGSLPPLLREFNRHTYAWLGGFHIWAKGYVAGVSWSFGFGHTGWEPPRTPEYFAWKRVSADKWEWKVSDDKSDSDKGTWPVKAEGKAKSYTYNELWFVPGQNVIHIKGVSKLWAEWEKSGWETVIEKGGSEVKFSVDISMDSVIEGGLKLNMNLPQTPKDIFKITQVMSPWGAAAQQDSSDDTEPEPERWETAEGDEDKIIPEAKAEEKKSINVKNIMEAANIAAGQLDFQSMTTNLQSALLNSARFVISGGRDFYHKNPVFNNNGDLLVEARYKS